MAVCWCSLAGTAACQHCRNNPFATEVWTNTANTAATDRIDAKPFGNGTDVCPVCGKPSTIGKPLTNADLYRAYSDEQIAELFNQIETEGKAYGPRGKKTWLDWLRQEATE